GDGQVEILELGIKDGSPALGSEIRELRRPRGALIGTILRGEKVLIPSGNDVLLAGDSVILIVAAKTLDAVRKVLLKR
ncbi:MAG: TrkA C-terminal domain-containing protein, partial [Verrucomicrobiales bacterium]